MANKPLNLAFIRTDNALAHLEATSPNGQSWQLPVALLRAAFLTLTHGAGRVEMIKLIKHTTPGMGLYEAKCVSDFLVDLTLAQSKSYVLGRPQDAVALMCAVEPRAAS